MATRGLEAPQPGWLDERLGLSSIRKFIEHKAVPLHSATMWYYFGGITLFLFVIQVLTGILLLLYYRPTTSEAFESVQFIMTRVKFGWLIRSVHSWLANLMILSAFIHMFSVVFLHAYRRPREMTWFSGIGLLALAMAFGFSGYLLPWNTISYFATKVGTDMAASVPVLGPHLARFLRGGEDVGGATLTRFFGFHVAVLPGITTLLPREPDETHQLSLHYPNVTREQFERVERRQEVPFRTDSRRRRCKWVCLFSQFPGKQCP